MQPGGPSPFPTGSKAPTNLEEWWPAIINRLAADTGRTDDLGKTLLNLQVRHIDGKTRASVRAQALNDLNADIPDGQCHIITNARCLTEGVDVPALDAVLFMEPRTSKVDIVQAVGRVMRRHEGKKRGYIVLPVIVPEGKRVTDSDVPPKLRVPAGLGCHLRSTGTRRANGHLGQHRRHRRKPAHQDQ